MPKVCGRLRRLPSFMMSQPNLQPHAGRQTGRGSYKTPWGVSLSLSLSTTAAGCLLPSLCCPAGYEIVEPDISPAGSLFVSHSLTLHQEALLLAGPGSGVREGGRGAPAERGEPANETRARSNERMSERAWRCRPLEACVCVAGNSDQRGRTRLSLIIPPPTTSQSG